LYRYVKQGVMYRYYYASPLLVLLLAAAWVLQADPYVMQLQGRDAGLEDPAGFLLPVVISLT